MHAMVMNSIGGPLAWTQLPDRQPGPGEIRVKVLACGVCRTDLHVLDGELPDPHVSIIPGHEIVGRVDALGAGVTGLQIGETRPCWYLNWFSAKRPPPRAVTGVLALFDLGTDFATNPFAPHTATPVSRPNSHWSI